jgi:hypothetical protein
LEDLSIFHDDKIDHVIFQDDGVWVNHIQQVGIKKCIELIRDTYWRSYEQYLVRLILKTKKIFTRQKATELLHEYFKFISVFGIEPGIKGDPDDIFLDNGDFESENCSEKYLELYAKLAKEVKTPYKKQVQRAVLTMLQKHSKINSHNLDSQIQVADT